MYFRQANNWSSRLYESCLKLHS